jgi:peptide chain release factor 1
MAQTVDDRLLSKLAEIAERRDALEVRMADPEIAADHTKAIALAKELGQLRYLADPYRELRKTLDSLDEARELIGDSDSDPDLRELAEAELPELTARYDEQLEALKDRVVTADDAAISSLDPGDCAPAPAATKPGLFARDLYEMYLRFCQMKGYKVEVLDQSSSDLGGLKEIILNIKGDGAWRALGYEGGGHRVQRVPETEAQGRIHTSAATVAVYPEPEELNIDINWDADVEEHVARASGPGGQKVNKTSSAIKLVHTRYRHHRFHPGREIAAQESGQGAPDHDHPRVRPLPAAADRRPGQRPQDDDRLRRPLPAHPHLQFPPEQVHRSPHRRHALQPRQDHARQPRRD